MKKKPKTELTLWKIPNIPDKKEIEKHTAPLIERAGKFEITSVDHYTASAVIAQDLDKAIALVGMVYDPFVDGLHKLHKMAIALRGNFLNPLTAARKRMKDIRVEWQQKQEEIKRRAEAKLAEGLRKQQQKELEKQARAAEKSGEMEMAEVLRAQADTVPLPVMKSEPTVPKQEGFVVRKRWVFRIVNPEKVQRQYCTPDAKLIRPVVEAMGPASAIEGIEVWEETNEYSRGVFHQESLSDA